METWEVVLEKRTELAEFGSNKLLLFALELHQDIDDIELVANDVLTDGSDDKKCDLVYLNPETGKVIIAQGYWATSKFDKSAPANKASDLNTASAWLLTSGYKDSPRGIRSAAEQIHDALHDGSVISIEFWYVHNRKESKNVQKELDKVVETAHALVRQALHNTEVDSISATEVGRETLDKWYKGTLAPILVTRDYELETKGGFRADGESWSAYSTSVPASWLREMFDEHGKTLFAANIRDYLGSRKSDRNINNNIKQTATKNPSMFWVFNNGITALVNSFDYTSEGDIGILHISGMAIVNGAQTTGALGAIEDGDLDNAFVPVRFVKCSDTTTIQDIIRYNNSQNRIEAADFRSNDAIQARLREEFVKFPEAEYKGGRRGGIGDAMKRSRSTLPSYAVGQALMAFHGEPAIAYNQRSEIWNSDLLYARIFNKKTTAQHVLCAYSLMKAINQAKLELRNVAEDVRTDAQRRQWEVWRQRGATFLVTAALAAGLETIVARQIPDRFRVQFSRTPSPDVASGYWRGALEPVLSLITYLRPALEGSNLKNKDTVKKVVDGFVDLVGSVREPNAQVFDKFAQRLNTCGQ